MFNKVAINIRFDNLQKDVDEIKTLLNDKLEILVRLEEMMSKPDPFAVFAVEREKRVESFLNSKGLIDRKKMQGGSG